LKTKITLDDLTGVAFIIVHVAMPIVQIAVKAFGNGRDNQETEHFCRGLKPS